VCLSLISGTMVIHTGLEFFCNGLDSIWVTIEYLCNCGFGICNSRCNVSSGTTWSCDWLHRFQRFHTLLNFLQLVLLVRYS